MKKKISKILTALLTVVLCAAVTAPAAFAAEKLSVTIPAEISLSGPQPSSPETFTVKLKADDAAFPMPEGAKDSIYKMTINGEGKKNFPDIRYERVGIYTYTISQEAGENEDCTYDDTVYKLAVYVTHAEDGSGLEVTAVLYPGNEDDKQDAAVFENKYKEKEKPAPDHKDDPAPNPGQESAPQPEPEATPQAAPAALSPKTGDTASQYLYLALAGASAAVILVLYAVRKKRSSAE